jgi:hypothetical protein
MRVLNSVIALDAPSVLVDEELIKPAWHLSAAKRTIHLSDAQWENLAVLTPEEHEEMIDGRWEIARRAFIDDEDTMGLERFISMVDEAGMSTKPANGARIGGSVDLAMWLRRWRA